MAIHKHVSAPIIPAPSGHRGWEVHAGALSVGSNGCHLRPQFLIGAEIGNFRAEAGIRDVRDGISVVAKAEVGMAVESTGHSIRELHESIRCDTIVLREALDVTKRILKQSVDKIASVLKMNKEELERNLEGAGETAYRPMRMRAETNIDLGLEMTVCLGWKDTQGYRMVGVGMECDALVDVGGKLFAGRHKSKETAKIIIGITNFAVEYIIPIRQIRTPCPTCSGTGKHNGFLGRLRSCATCKGKGYVKTV